jgi:hypothetical protein
MVAGSHSQGELTWQTSAPSRSPEFQGEIVTHLQSKRVRIVPETDRASDNAFSRRRNSD